jgi:hypothetical protein
MMFAGALVLAACGTDDGTESEAGDSSTSVADGDSETSESTAPDDDAGSGDESGVGDESGEDATDDNGGADERASGDGSFDNDQFCAAVADLDEALDLSPPLLDTTRSPDEVELLVDDVEAKFDAVAQAAPPEIQSDWMIVGGAFMEMTGLIKDANYDVTAVDQVKIAELGASEEALAAGDRIDPVTDEYCPS